MENERDRKIRERAYALWEEGGRAEGQSDQHWREAEAQFAGGSESPVTDDSTSATRPAAVSKGASPPKRAPAAPRPTGTETSPKRGGGSRTKPKG